MLSLYLKLSCYLLRLPCAWRRLLAVLLLAFVALLATNGVGMLGFYDEAELFLVSIFANHPFYMSAEEAQWSILSAGATGWLCVLLACYAAAILLHESRLAWQVAMLALSLLVLAVASCCAVFWGGVLNVSAPACCLFFVFLCSQLVRPLGWLHRFILKRA
ncbi:MAG: hypothetical protein R3Y56_08855 [Akkermansia sp.]